MLSKEIQIDILSLLAADLKYVDSFKNAGLELENWMFEDKNKKTLQAIKKAKKLGYEQVTKKFINENNIRLVINPSNDNFLDLSSDVRKEVQSIYDQVFQEKINKAIEEYTRASYEDKPTLKKKLADLSMAAKTVQRQSNTRTAEEVIDEDYYADEEKGRIKTYLADLDEKILNGGFTRQGMHIISGFPGNGKSTLGVQTGVLQAMHDYKVLYITLEETADKVISNVLSVSSKYKNQDRDYWELSKLKKSEESIKRQEAKEIVKHHVSDKFNIDDTNWNNQNEFIERIRYAILVEQYDVIIIDNFQNAPKRTDLNVEINYANLADTLLGIVRSYDSKSIIICMSQLTIENKREKTKYSNHLNENAVTQLKIERSKNVDDNVNDEDTVTIKANKARDGVQEKQETFSFLGHKSMIGTFIRPHKENVSKDRTVPETKERKFEDLEKGKEYIINQSNGKIEEFISSNSQDGELPF